MTELTAEAQSVSNPTTTDQITVAPAIETATPESVEPQNPLTQKFTEQEWTALKEFTVRDFSVVPTGPLA
jgi:hypothetical protein